MFISTHKSIRSLVPFYCEHHWHVLLSIRRPVREKLLGPKPAQGLVSTRAWKVTLHCNSLCDVLVGCCFMETLILSWLQMAK